MREILFRGKHKDSGEWVYGLLGRYNADFECANIIDEFELLVPVKTETVGQYTGLKDKNGKMIFEGDIVIDKYSCEKFGFVGAVKYNEKLTKYQIVSDKYPNHDVGLGSRRDSIRILGNIHDNPELLKGE